MTVTVIFTCVNMFISMRLKATTYSTKNRQQKKPFRSKTMKHFFVVTFQLQKIN